MIIWLIVVILLLTFLPPSPIFYGKDQMFSSTLIALKLKFRRSVTMIKIIIDPAIDKSLIIAILLDLQIKIWNHYNCICIYCMLSMLCMIMCISVYIHLEYMFTCVCVCEVCNYTLLFFHLFSELNLLTAYVFIAKQNT